MEQKYHCWKLAINPSSVCVRVCVYPDLLLDVTCKIPLCISMPDVWQTQ